MLIASLLLLACGRDALDPSPRFTPPPASDAGVAARDAGRPTMRPDGGRPDAGAPDTDLARALACDLDADAALRAVTRFVACDPAAERSTVVAIMEAWEAGLLARVEESGGLVEGLAADLGCEVWGCVAAAASCDAYGACLEAARRPMPCEPFTTLCAGDTLMVCGSDGAEARTLVDCARFDAICQDGACQIGECRFGRDYYHLGCDADANALVLCDGARRVDCDDVLPGSRCASFHIGGEVPTQWCSPTGGSAAGAYPREVDSCAGGVFTFESVSGVTYSLDCRAEGYRNCTVRGCRA